MNHLARTPDPPYYAVIFTSTASDDTQGYESTAEQMIELAARQPGFLGVESASERSIDGGLGITVSYWESEEAIASWKADTRHTAARNDGRARWYDAFEVRVARVERAYNWHR